MVRDWSAEGEQERTAIYIHILSALNSCFPTPQGIKVLVPGAGLGRLVYEICQRGFTSQGNEFSYYMLLASNFILNSTSQPAQYDIYPWIHTYSNTISAATQTAKVSIPDIAIIHGGDMSMVAGDFVQVYKDPTQLCSWDSVVTAFFLDTTRNMVEYIETIKSALKEDGVWINIGPLQYHFEGGDGSIEYTQEEVRELVISFGFTIVSEDFVQSGYASNPNSMLQHVYTSWFFVAQLTGTQSERADN
jgi:carnosine N-methyltransferase